MNNEEIEEEEIFEKILELRRHLNLSITIFLNDNSISGEEAFKIIGPATSSLIAELLFALYKKDCEDFGPFEYIEGICESAKFKFLEYRKFQNIIKNYKKTDQPH